MFINQCFNAFASDERECTEQTLPLAAARVAATAARVVLESFYTKEEIDAFLADEKFTQALVDFMHFLEKPIQDPCGILAPARCDPLLWLKESVTQGGLQGGLQCVMVSVELFC